MSLDVDRSAICTVAKSYNNTTDDTSTTMSPLTSFHSMHASPTPMCQATAMKASQWQPLVLTVSIFVVLFPLATYGETTSELLLRLKRAWLDDLPMPSHQAYLGDVCTNSSKCLVPNSICVPSENIYWNRQSFCVCKPGYHPSTGHCDDDTTNTTESYLQNFRLNLTSVLMTTTAASYLSPDSEMSTGDVEKMTMERNAVTVLPAFFSKLKLSNHTQKLISTMVQQLSSYQNSGEDLDEYGETETSPGQTSWKSNNTSPLCNGSRCNPPTANVNNRTSVDVSVQSKTGSLESEVDSYVNKNIEDLLANTPTKPTVSDHNVSGSKAFVFPASYNPYSNIMEHGTKTKTTSRTSAPVSSWIHIRTKPSTMPTPVQTSSEFEWMTSSSSERETSSPYKLVINPQDLTKNVDLYALLKTAAEDIMRQYFNTLLTNSTLFPRLWADVKQLKHNLVTQPVINTSTTSTSVPPSTDKLIFNIDEFISAKESTMQTLMSKSSKSYPITRKPFIFKVINKDQSSKPPRISFG